MTPIRTNQQQLWLTLRAAVVGFVINFLLCPIWSIRSAQFYPAWAAAHRAAPSTVEGQWHVLVHGFIDLYRFVRPGDVSGFLAGWIIFGFIVYHVRAWLGERAVQIKS